MKAEIKNNELTITLTIEKKESKSGKSIVIATTNGNVTNGLEYEGNPVIIGVNAYIKK